MIPKLHPRTADVLHLAKVASALEKLTVSHPDESTREKAAIAKENVTDNIFRLVHFSSSSHLKTAAEQDPVYFSAGSMASIATTALGTSTSLEKRAFLEEAVEKLAAVGVIEGMLASVSSDMTEDATKLATTIRHLNRSYGVKLLGEIANV